VKTQLNFYSKRKKSLPSSRRNDALQHPMQRRLRP
jgi:hypothetical protein